MAQSRPGHIHGRISHADDSHPVAQIVHIRIYQVINGKMHISQGLPFYAQGLRTPHAGSDENAFVAVPEQILDLQSSADGCIGTDPDSNGLQFLLIPLQNGLRKPEFRTAGLLRFSPWNQRLSHCIPFSSEGWRW